MITRCVYLDENAMQLSRCAGGASPQGRMPEAGAAGRAAFSRADLDLVGISLERR